MFAVYHSWYMRFSFSYTGSMITYNIHSLMVIISDINKFLKFNSISNNSEIKWVIRNTSSRPPGSLYYTHITFIANALLYLLNSKRKSVYVLTVLYHQQRSAMAGFCSHWVCSMENHVSLFNRWAHASQQHYHA